MVEDSLAEAAEVEAEASDLQIKILRCDSVFFISLLFLL